MSDPMMSEHFREQQRRQEQSLTAEYAGRVASDVGEALMHIARAMRAIDKAPVPHHFAMDESKTRAGLSAAREALLAVLSDTNEEAQRVIRSFGP
jgi:hypothetical protein